MSAHQSIDIKIFKDYPRAYKLALVQNGDEPVKFCIRKINYARDNGDFRAGRIYLPLEVAHEFALAILKQTSALMSSAEDTK